MDAALLERNGCLFGGGTAIDLIDLAMIDAPKEQLRQAAEKARGAYGDAVERDLQRSIQRLGERTGRLDECMRALKIDRMPKAVLWSRIRRLRAGRLEEK